MTEKNNQDLTKVYELIQKQNQWRWVKDFAQTALTLIPTLFLIWKSFKRKRANSAVRLIRKKGEIAKTELRHKAEMAQKNLELETLEREVQHEAELKEFELGLKKKEEEEIISKDLLGDLKKETGEVIQRGVNKAKEVGDQVKGLKNKFLDPEKEKKE